MLLDFRTPWTRARDAAGDVAITALKEALTMQSLLDDRRSAVKPLGNDFCPSGGLRVVLSRPQFTEREIRQVIDPRIHFILERDLLTDGIVWTATFEISGRHMTSERQQRRIQLALKELVESQSHLLRMETSGKANCLHILMKVQIGVLVEPSAETY